VSEISWHNGVVTQPDLTADLALAAELADAADAVSMKYFGSQDLGIQTKADDSPVTIADKRAEQAIRHLLAAERPADSIWGEEFGSDAGAERRWIIDPIDGTKNYLRGVPVWATLIGLQIDGDLVLGMVSAPAMGRRWWASSGQGAWTRTVAGKVQRLRPSAINQLSEASFSFSDEDYWRERGSWTGLRALIDTCWRTRGYGDFWSHILVAEGAVDIAAEPALMPWDMAALIPIITESGGRITGFTGQPPLKEGCAVSTNGHLHELVLGVLRPKV
jgi:histidinol-phosphatase